MAMRWMMLLWLALLFLNGPAKAQEDRWTVEPFSDTLSGKTVTVARKMWMEGALTGEEQEGPMHPETVFALRCLQTALPGETLTLELEAEYAAAVTVPDQETGGWVAENAWQYGLIVEGETEENGQRLHLRYVGPVHAAAMRALGLNRTGYLLFLRRMGQAALKRNGNAVAWIFCIPTGGAVTFTLPEGAAWEISGDGAGGVIIAVRSGC